MPPLRNPQIAAALERVHQSASDGIVQTDSIARRDRELLISAGWLLEILRGWYLLITPNAKKGDTVIWHSSFWAFAAAYLESRFAKRYVLSPEASLDLHTGITGTPKQLTVLTASGGNTKIDLPIGSSIFMHANPDTLPSSRRHAELAVFDYIETFYNPTRRHSSLGYLSPVAFENQQKLKDIIAA